LTERRERETTINKSIVLELSERKGKYVGAPALDPGTHGSVTSGRNVKRNQPLK